LNPPIKREVIRGFQGGKKKKNKGEKIFGEGLSNPIKFTISRIWFVFARSKEKKKAMQH